jgi:hypothetical protein
MQVLFDDDKKFEPMWTLLDTYIFVLSTEAYGGSFCNGATSCNTRHRYNPYRMADSCKSSTFKFNEADNATVSIKES